MADLKTKQSILEDIDLAELEEMEEEEILSQPEAQGIDPRDGSEDDDEEEEESAA